MARNSTGDVGSWTLLASVGIARECDWVNGWRDDGGDVRDAETRLMRIWRYLAKRSRRLRPAARVI